MTSEIKLYIESKNSFVHPDAMVICGEVEKSKDDKNAVTKPTLIVEVLSKSTAGYTEGINSFFTDKFLVLENMSS